MSSTSNARLPVETKSHLPSIGLEIYKNLTMGDVERHRFKAGDVIFTQEGDPRGEAYVIHSGAVEIRTKINGADRVLNRLGVGQLFGVLALFLRSPRSASAVAVSDTELLIIKNERRGPRTRRCSSIFALGPRTVLAADAGAPRHATPMYREIGRAVILEFPGPQRSRAHNNSRASERRLTG